MIIAGRQGQLRIAPQGKPDIDTCGKGRRDPERIDEMQWRDAQMMIVRGHTHDGQAAP